MTVTRIPGPVLQVAPDRLYDAVDVDELLQKNPAAKFGKKYFAGSSTDEGIHVEVYDEAEVAKILKAEGFNSSFDQPTPREIVLKMKYIGGKVPAVSGLRRISRPGLRVYARKTEMPRVLGGLGVAIVSTSSGVMTGREAEKKGLGGEVLAYIW